MKLKKFSVSSLTNYIKVSLESDILLSNIDVEGEVSNLKYHTNGNVYFSLKDEFSKINCVVFKNHINDLDFKINEGDNLNIVGSISLYAKEGSYQIICYVVKKQGVGDLYKKFEELKLSLSSKGYFDEMRKKSIPEFCFNIGIITSSTGAVINDILNVRLRKNKLTNVKIFDSLVQGPNAYKSIIEGIRYFNIEKNVDVIIIARGGGSIEDLWTFNEKDLAEEIFKSETPIVSGVGHETDFTICDFTSDVRASTPTAAADLCISDLNSILLSIDDYREKLYKSIVNRLNSEKGRVFEKLSLVKEFSPRNILRHKKDTIINKYISINNIVKKSLLIHKEKLNLLRILLEKNDFKRFMEKGFVIIKREDGSLIKTKCEIKSEQDIILTFSDGIVFGSFKKKEMNDFEKHNL